MVDLIEWNDGRLNDLQRTVERMQPAVEAVAVLGRDVSTLSERLSETTAAMGNLAEKLTDFMEEMHQDALNAARKPKESWTRIREGAMAAAVGAGFGSLLAYILISVH